MKLTKVVKQSNKDTGGGVREDFIFSIKLQMGWRRGGRGVKKVITMWMSNIYPGI